MDVQRTGRRIALPPPDCATDAAGCDEGTLLNELGGWSVNPRISIRFSGPIALDSVTRASAFIVPLWSEPMPTPVGLQQLVWDGESETLALVLPGDPEHDVREVRVPGESRYVLRGDRWHSENPPR